MPLETSFPFERDCREVPEGTLVGPWRAERRTQSVDGRNKTERSRSVEASIAVYTMNSREFDPGQLRCLICSSHQLLFRFTRTARPISTALDSHLRLALRPGCFPLRTRGSGLEPHVSLVMNRVRRLTGIHNYIIPTFRGCHRRLACSEALY